MSGSKRKQQEDYGLELQKSYDMWARIYEYGCSDPLWSDGVNLNLVHNHILYYRRKIEETMPADGYPAAYYKEVPPEVDYEYVARAEEIRAAARVALAKYKADPNYQYILRRRDDFTKKTRDRLCIGHVIGYATGLEEHIEKDRLVDMRRHEDFGRYLQSFEDCARKMRETPPEEVQFSLFSFSGDYTAEQEGDGIGGYTDGEYGGLGDNGGAEM
jgi:hypothetical protein